MQFIDLKAQQALIRERIESNISKVLDHGQYIMGPEVQELEEALADYVGVKHCIAVSSGTDALMIAMMALGIGAGDEVITTPFTFIATGEMISLLGATPVFVDIDPETYNLSPSAIKDAISENTRLIMPVSLYGQCADFDEINAIAKQYGLPVIEDAAQSFGATYKGKKSCALTTISCTSFFPSKPLGCYGDAGACFTDDDDLAIAMKQIRVHGQDRRYHHPRIGLNGRIDTLQAAILLAKMELFPDEVIARSNRGSSYSNKIREAGIDVTVPFIKSHNTSVYAQYTLAVRDREFLTQKLNEDGIPVAVHYPMPLNKQPAFNSIEKTSCRLPNAETAAMAVLCLPMHPYLEDLDIDRVVESLSRHA